mmetsp:Transcript_8991/g.32847  ORF Transcript_8991/g.32847 Transcript_8991/m.32847 type:complete len:330 (+) Transcript_8991:622-1611(+)
MHVEAVASGEIRERRERAPGVDAVVEHPGVGALDDAGGCREGGVREVAPHVLRRVARVHVVVTRRRAPVRVLAVQNLRRRRRRRPGAKENVVHVRRRGQKDVRLERRLPDGERHEVAPGGLRDARGHLCRVHVVRASHVAVAQVPVRSLRGREDLVKFVGRGKGKRHRGRVRRLRRRRRDGAGVDDRHRGRTRARGGVRRPSGFHLDVRRVHRGGDVHDGVVPDDDVVHRAPSLVDAHPQVEPAVGASVQARILGVPPGLASELRRALLVQTRFARVTGEQRRGPVRGRDVRDRHVRVQVVDRGEVEHPRIRAGVVFDGDVNVVVGDVV